MPKQVRRSFASCWTCRRRRVACDGALPACSPCQKILVQCEGYSVHLVWVDGKTGSYESRSRRTLNPRSTWAGHRPYRTAQLQHLTNVDCEDVCCECELHTADSNPFGVFRPARVGPEQDIISSPAESSDHDGADSPAMTVSPTPSNPPTMESMLLHHYVNQVAYLLMPVDSQANPWRSIYPAIAIQQSSDASRSLYHALLSQAAFHLSVLQANKHDIAQKYTLQAMKHYCYAVQGLRTSLDQIRDFKACAAVLYTFGQIEGCYARELTDWRKHFHGMSGLLSLFSQDSPWKMSSDAWVISQSLALSSEIAYTGTVAPSEGSQLTEILLGSISEVYDFGYTIGASSGVIQSIAKIRRLSEALPREGWSGEVDVESGRILGEIELAEPGWVVTLTPENRQEYLNSLHRRIFQNAAIIYLFRTIYNVAPQAISDRITEILRDTVDFLDLGGGSVSLWPVFITAVEASTQQERKMVKKWLDYSCELGISNRLTARCIIEEVWRLRDQEALLRGTEPENVAVDWRDAQSELKVDILLL